MSAASTMSIDDRAVSPSDPCAVREAKDKELWADCGAPAGSAASAVPRGLRTAESSIVMAASQTSENVEVPLTKSVVEHSTTDADASKSHTASAASGRSHAATTNNNSITVPTSTTTTTTTTTTAIITSASTATTSSITTGFPAASALASDPKNENAQKNAASREAGSSSINGAATHGAKDGVRFAEAENGASRPRSTSPNKVERKPSVKKTSFKPVSLNKQFLKETVPAAPAPSASLSTSLQSKGISSATSLSAPRPTAASKLKLTRTGAASQGAGSNGPGSTGPGSTRAGPQPVWNKNKPTPPPPPATKDFTDEELKKQYGIHLASRLGPENAANKEQKWADIDDDDDDWVPETIEWNYGMKMSHHQEEQKPTKPESEPTKPVPNPPAPSMKAVTQPAAPTPHKTPVLTIKDGRPKTLITEKSSSKSPDNIAAATPRPSPWAKLPPANAVPPVAINPPQPVRAPEPFHRHDEPSRDGHPIREVSAEVFDRSWRERSGSRDRELFNSRTGQMEPVQDDRSRASKSGRNEPVTKPAVLQRPSGPPPPAEPSPAFQQHRTSHRPDEYRRRRTSSNVSGGSGSIGRRQSFSRYGPEPDDGLLHGRPSSHVGPFDDLPPRSGFSGTPHPPFVHPNREISPRMAHANAVPQPPHEASSPAPQHAQPELPEPPAPAESPAESPAEILAKQERVMRESRESARKRRQEEEEREEAAKRERLRAKLELLEKQAKEKVDKEAAAKKAEEERIAAEEAAEEEEERRRLVEEEASRQRQQQERESRERAEAEKRAAAASTTTSTTTTTTTSGRTLQWEKVRDRAPLPSGPGPIHQPHTPNLQGRQYQPQPHPHPYPPAANTNTGPPSRYQRDSLNHHPTNYPPRQSISPSLPDKSSSSTTVHLPSSTPYHPYQQTLSSTQRVMPSTLTNSQQPQARASQENLHAPRQPATHNTFAAGQHVTRQLSPDMAPMNAPPGPPSHVGPDHDQPKNMSSLPLGPPAADAGSQWGAVGERPRPLSPGEPQSTGTAIERPQPNGFSGGRYYGSGATPPNNGYRPGNVRPNDRRARVPLTAAQEAVANRWNAAPQQIQAAEREAAFYLGKERAAQREAMEKGIAPKVPAGPVVQHRIRSREWDDEPAPILPKAPAIARPSRFFPTAAEKEPPRPVSPPPPMSPNHPVHGDAKSCVVHLPPSSSNASPSSTGPGFAPRLPQTHKTESQYSAVEKFEAVQQRILKLTGGIVSPSSLPTNKEPVETASTRAQLVPPVANPTVSLPQGGAGVIVESISTVPDYEDFLAALFEQDFGSTPTVKIPPPAAHGYLGRTDKAPETSRHSKRGGPWLPSRAIISVANVDLFSRGSKIIIHLPGMVDKVEVARAPGEQGQGRPRGANRGRGRGRQNATRATASGGTTSSSGRGRK